MTIAEKLTTIAENQQKIYDAGYKKGLSGGSSEIKYDSTYITLATAITERQFQAGAGLDGTTTVILPNVESIGTAAFYNATIIETVDIGANVQTIHFSAFNNCQKLSKLIFRGLWLAEERTLALSQTAIKYGEGYIFVPDEYLEQYKSATNWSTFASQIKPISELEGGGGTVEIDAISNNSTTVGQSIFAGKITVVTSDGNEVEVKKAKLPNVTAIYSGVFGSGSTIEVLDVGSGDTMLSLNGYTFAYNSNLKTLILRGWIDACGGGAYIELEDTPIANGNGYIYVPDEYLEGYKTQSNWSAIASQIKPISELEGE